MSTKAHKAAFFDVDNTLLDAKSMFSFQSYYLDHWLPTLSPAGSLRSESFAQFSYRFEQHAKHHDRQALNRMFYGGYAGHSLRSMRKAAVAWFTQLEQRSGSLRIEPVLTLAEELRGQGYQMVSVSGSSHEILAPLIERLDFDDCLATRLEVDGDRLTCCILAPQMIGVGKGDALRDWALGRSVDLRQSVACGDHLTDLQMLECVGRPYVVAGDPLLEQVAAERGWPILRVNATDECVVHA